MSWAGGYGWEVARERGLLHRAVFFSWIPIDLFSACDVMAWAYVRPRVASFPNIPVLVFQSRQSRPNSYLRLIVNNQCHRSLLVNQAFASGTQLAITLASLPWRSDIWVWNWRTRQNNRHFKNPFPSNSNQDQDPRGDASTYPGVKQPSTLTGARR